MAKNIVMNVLTNLGYEEMYPFTPRQILNATFDTLYSNNLIYSITIPVIPNPLTNDYGNDMGIIVFTPTFTNMDYIRLSINKGKALPILSADGVPLRAGTLKSNVSVFVKYRDNNFYLITNKEQVGLGNVDNTSDINKPISTATQNALNGKLNTPVAIPRNANLNNYKTAGLFYNISNGDASTIANVPKAVAFSLFVERHAGVKQTFSSYYPSGVQVWVRNYFNGVWSSWYQEALLLSGTTNPDNSWGADGNIYLKYS